MAIKIPSKNIYNINNPKIVKNAVNSVSVGKKTIAKDDSDKTSVFTYSDWDYEGHSISQVYNLISNTNQSLSTPQYNINFNKYIGYFGYIFVNSQKVHNVTIKIPVVRESSFIEKLYLGTETQGEGEFSTTTNNIQVNFTGTKTSGIANIDSFAQIMDSNYSDYYFNVSVDEWGVNYVTNETIDNVIYSIPQKIEIEHTVEYPEYNPSLQPKTIKNELEVIDVGNVPTATAKHIIDGDDEYYQIELIVFTSFRQTSLAGYYDERKSLNLPSNVVSQGYFILNGDWEQYEVTELQVTFNGKVVGIKLEDKTDSFGDDKNPYIITANELLQNTSSRKNIEISKSLANDILREYKNGKETAVVSCVVGEYYDENGNLTISTKQNGLPMTFNIGDIVIPMVRGANGSDQPMSKLKNGEQKQFRVVGVKTIYDGAILQEITLQEFDKANIV